MKKLSAVTLNPPKLRGQWVYIGGRIPATSDNTNLKTLQQL